MAPETRLEVVQAAVAAIPTKMPSGPVQPTWDSLQTNYKVPQWLVGAKFGVFMHFGIYTVPAHHNEWYEQHMYTDGAEGRWHVEHYGSQDKFGYKDFIPMFKVEKFDPEAWAELFKKAGAKFVVPTAEHHENFAMWDSAVTPFNAMQMGPHRDVIGELAKAVRAHGLKFGVSNHGIENFQFIHAPADMIADMKAKQTDLFDPKWVDFYNVADRSDAACKKFLVNWFERDVELIDKYQPDMLWFDNGVDIRYLDPLKLKVAAYYYDRAKEWGKEVTLCTKKAAYAPGGDNTNTIGSVIDFEKIGARSPSGIRTGVWVVDDPIGSTWGYTTDMTVASAASIVSKLVDTASKNGTLLLNLSPMSDGTFPQAQQDTLLGVGQWLDINGEAIYGTHNWIKFGEGNPRDRTSLNIRFTVKDETLYAIILGAWPGAQAVITSLPSNSALEGKIETIRMLGAEAANLAFTQDAQGLKVTLPAVAPCKYAYTLKITGLKMNPPTWTESGNPL
jgi:alpha-L-fucosidase